MLRTPTPRSGMPFFRSVEPAARNLRPLSDHRLIVSPLLTPPADEAPRLRSRIAGHSQTLLGGVAVLAVAGALSAGMGSSGHAVASTPASPVISPASPAALAPAAFAATAPAAKAPSASAAKATAHAHSPTLRTNPNAPRGAAIVTHQDTVNVRAMAGDLSRLRSCESGGNYHEASGNGYYGAYQFDLSTWRSLGLSGYPSNASRQLQDVAVTRLEARKGWGPWPVCSYVAGLR